ncbi:hypothetical protein CAP35_13410 [Chitinophagaceae bacterium IBVUCB1]|jgi:hypothetical protein|nr:hypothetical protein CAP35_13410 [Chitinophagaceae bacterium IBVUCB1]
MKENILSYDEAVELCAAHQHIVGQLFCGEYREFGQVEAVVIAPANKLDKWAFTKYYQKFNDAKQALAFYTGYEYDVVLIGKDNTGNVVSRELSAHLAFANNAPDFFTELD